MLFLAPCEELCDDFHEFFEAWEDLEQRMSLARGTDNKIYSNNKVFSATDLGFEIEV